MKEKNLKRIKGSISILLVIILLPMMTFSAIIVDMSRVNMAKEVMSSAGDLAMNTALANYDTILKDVYGLFAMSQAAGQTEEELKKEITSYFAKTISSYGVVSEEDADDYVSQIMGDWDVLLNGVSTDSLSDFLQLENIDVTPEKVKGSSLANSNVMRKQIVEYMKYRAPVGVGLSFLDSLKSFEKIDDQNAVVEGQVATQQSTQDVTKACQVLIAAIRAYDTMIKGLDEKGLSGVTSSTDSAYIKLEDYDTHVLKYKEEWEENYKHINLLTTIFLTGPSADSVWLKDLSYGTREIYVDNSGSLYTGSNTGFSVSVDLVSELEGAKTQVLNQITLLREDSKKDYFANAKLYATPILPSTLLTYTSVNNNDTLISKENEDEAIKAFIAFESFLLDKPQDNRITYSQAKAILEQIAILGKYWDNYEVIVNGKISEAEARLAEAEEKYGELLQSQSTSASQMDTAITNINAALSEYTAQYESVAQSVAYLSILGAETQNAVRGAVQPLPAREAEFSAYYNANIAKGSSDKYINSFKLILNAGCFGEKGAASAQQKKIVEKVKAYVGENGYDKAGFASAFEKTLSNADKTDPLFKLLCALKSCHDISRSYNAAISVYEEATEKLPAALQEKTNAEKSLSSLETDKETVSNDVASCLQSYHTFCSNYQGDAYYYDIYIIAAKNTLSKEANAIKVHFTKLLENLNAVKTDLENISKNIGDVRTAIEEYNKKLENWEKAKDDYEDNCGSDGFSDQSTDDIEKARNEYNDAIYESLAIFVDSIKKEYETLYNKLKESGNFVYGSKRIDEISTAEDLISAISGTTFVEIVTKDDAANYLTSLYKGESVEYVPYTMDYTEPPQLGFLAPQILQLQALKYLNASYPVKEGGQSDADKELENSYNETKEQLAGRSGELKDVDPNEPTSTELKSGGFSYTYDEDGKKDKITNTKDDIPDDSQYQLKISGEGENEKLEASGSVEAQNKKSNSVLDGIGSAMETAVENLYILNYIFENFSYNTIVQDQVVKDNDSKIKKNADTVIGRIAEADTLFTTGTFVHDSKLKITTLSNYPINEKNNYLYGGEIEYILFGNKTPKNNVTAAKASIYAIRFAFNCVFVFTDSEIRNTTMSAGLAVQAATLGFVPYQLVQIVLQLALAAAESALDLSAMSHGLSVAIVKTKETWSLSLSGAKNALKDAGNAAVQAATNEFVDKGVQELTTGLNKFLDSGADNLKEAATNLTNDLGKATKSSLESVVDSVVSSLMSEVEAGLNTIKNASLGDGNTAGGWDKAPSKAEVLAQAETVFNNIDRKINTIVDRACGDNESAASLVQPLKDKAKELVGDMKTSVVGVINDATDADLVGVIAEKMDDFKLELLEKANRLVDKLSGDIASAAETAIEETKEKIEKCVSQYGEKAAETIKDEINTLTQDFMDNKLKIPTSSSTESGLKGAAADLFTFGYKDYLMLLTYISICVNDDAILSRTADIIQLNLQFAKTGNGASFEHPNADNFKMADAYTYVSVSASADLDMFFMNWDIFKDQASDGDEGAADEDGGTSLNYKGILGY